MRKNPYEQGDQLSRNDNWGLQEGIVEEVIVNEVKEDGKTKHTAQYYYVRTFNNDLVLCKTLNPFAGNGYGAVYPFFKDDHVVIGFINGNPNCQAYILGGVHDQARIMPEQDGASLEDARIYVPKDHKIVERSNNKVTVVNKSTPSADDGNHLIYAEGNLGLFAKKQVGIMTVTNFDGSGDTKSAISMEVSQPGITITSKNDIDIRSKKDVVLAGNYDQTNLKTAPIPNGIAIAELMRNIKILLESLGAIVPQQFDTRVTDLLNENCGVLVKIK